MEYCEGGSFSSLRIPQALFHAMVQDGMQPSVEVSLLTNLRAFLL